MSHSVVVGGAGFVGSWVVEEILKDADATVTIIDNLISSEKWNISIDPRITFIEGSAAEPITFEKITGYVDFVYQLACFHGNQSSIARPLEDIENGLKSTLVTLEWVRNFCPNARVLYSGAGCAVAEKTWESPQPIKEIDTTSLWHDSPYSISKISGEMYCLFYAKQFDLDVIRVRFQNVFGPREILGAGMWRGTEHTIWRNVIPTFIWKALNNMDIDVFGSGSRDFVYVRDIANGISLATKKGESTEVYNLATGQETPIIQLANKILLLTNSKSEIILHERRKWDNSGRRLGDIQKSQSNIGFQSTFSLNEGLHRTIEWTISNFNIIQEQISRHGGKI
jgi:nucleoside-diphosphate-sugar epimerase